MKVFIGVMSLIAGLGGLVSAFGAVDKISKAESGMTYLAALVGSMPQAFTGFALLMIAILLAVYARIAQASAYQERNHSSTPAGE